MGKNAKLKKQRKIALFNAEPDWDKPELLHQQLEYWLNHDLTKSWIKSQWSFLIGDRPFISEHQQNAVVSRLLKLTFSRFKESYDLERVELPLQNPTYDLAVWLDSYEWIIWTGIKDRSSDEVFITSDGDEFDLRQISSD